MHSSEEKIVFRILAVDDDETILGLYQWIFSEFASTALKQSIQASDAAYLSSETAILANKIGFDLQCVDNATDAVAHVERANQEKTPFSLCLLDIRMPNGPDGLWAAEEIRKLDQHIDIVIVSAYSDFNPETMSPKLGPANKLFYLRKPFHRVEILQLATALSAKWLADRYIRHLAYFDPLTGLPNRRMLLARADQAVELAKRYGRHLAVLFVDLDGFKHINDTLGHSIGDLLLQQVGERLTGSMRASDALTRHSLLDRDQSVARLGGDEFTLLLSEINHSHDAVIVAQRLIDKLSAPYQLAGHEVHVSPSIGIALYPQDGDDAETLLKHADMAMYQAKRNIGQHLECFNSEMRASAMRRLKLENQLRRDIAKERLSLLYQPLCDVADKRIRGLEALLRWTDDEFGEISPEELIRIAEESGLIFELGNWVIQEACEQAAKWRSRDLEFGSISVNISSIQMVRPGFCDHVVLMLDRFGLPASLLQLEVTESLLMKEKERAIPVLQRLRELGCRVLVDDFGTGYSSIGSLQQLPVDGLKIDQIFVQGIDVDEEKATITRVMLSLSAALGLEVIAEGVETEAQLALLHRHGCSGFQGFLVSQPVSAKEIASLLGATGLECDHRAPSILPG